MILSYGAGMHWSQTERAWFGLVIGESDGRLMLRRELTWRGIAPEQAALDVLALMKALKIESLPVFAQPELFPSKHSRGETIAESFRRLGIALYPGDDDLINGLSRVRSWFSLKKIRVHQDCKRFIRTFPTLMSVDGKPDEIDPTRPEAYPANGLRYYLMSRPSPATAPPPPPLPENTWGYALRHHFEPRREFIGGNLK